MKVCILVLNQSIYVYFHYIIICIFMFIQIWCNCVSNILQRMKTVNEIWCYEQLSFKLCFRAKYNLKPKMYIVVIWYSSYSSLFFLFTFQCFFLSVFSFSSMFSALLSITKKTMILSKYHSNMTLIRDY